MGHFMGFAKGLFMDVDAIKAHLQSLSQLMDSNPIDSGQQ